MSSKRTSLEQVLAEAPLSSFRGQDAGSRSVLEPTANSPNTASLAHCAEFEEFTAGQRGLLESPKHFVSAFASFTHLQVLAGDHRCCQHKGSKPSVFFRSRRATICIKEYVQRIAVHSKCSPVCFASAYVYLQRLSKAGPQYKICSGSVHRLLIAAVLIAAKLMDDKFYSNSFYARIGGISTKELNQLELEMLKLLEFRAFVSFSELSEVLSQLLACNSNKATPPDPTSASRRSKKRGQEDPLAEPEDSIPAKLQHDSHKDQILVTPALTSLEDKAVPGKNHASHTTKVALQCQEAERGTSSGVRAIQVQLAICAGGK